LQRDVNAFVTLITNGYGVAMDESSTASAFKNSALSFGFKAPRFSPEHFDFLDALRGLAILGVVVCHVCLCTDEFHGRWRIYFSKGSYGVQLFFLVSAFTLFGSLASRGHRERKPIHAFFTRRLFRIGPLFWCASAIYLWKPDMWRSLEAPAGVHWLQIITTLLSVHGWSATTVNSIVPGGWSIAAEVMFYLCMPYLFFRIKTLIAALRLTVICMSLVALAFPFALTHSEAHYPRAWGVQADAFIQRSFIAQFPVFCLGFVLYFLLIQGGCVLKTTAKNASLHAWFFISMFACIFFCDLPPYLPISIAFLSLAYGVSLHPVFALVNPVTKFLGKVSYSIYVWHFFILERVLMVVNRSHYFAYAHNQGNSLARFSVLLVVTLGITVPVAFVSHYLIELPGQQFGKWIITKMRWGIANAKPS
jgi:peptidoglycan/LPS O-acetylase OafA/YrhL